MTASTEKSPSNNGGVDYSAEQTFQHWASRRIELYRETEQQVQTGVAHLLQLASEFTVQMEQETERLLARYQQTRNQYQQEIDQLRQEKAARQAEIERESQEHQDRLKQERADHDDMLNQERQQAREKIESEQAAAAAQRDQMLREARAERDRIVEETRQLSTRLAELQQSLQGLLGAQSLLRDVQPQAAPVTPVVQATPAAPAAQPGASRLIVQAVPSIDRASEFMDRLDQQPDINATQLVSYEQETLVLLAKHAPELDLVRLLRDHFADVLEIVGVEQGNIRLRLVPATANGG